MATIVAIVACHNRKELTLQCLDQFFSERVGLEQHAVVFDDGSTDGTGQAASARFGAKLTLITGDGSYFWNAAMSVAFAEAIARKYDFYLWLNDDVDFDAGYLERLLSAQKRVAGCSVPAIVVGATRNAQTKQIIYGGLTVSNRKVLKLELCDEREEPVACDTFSGNCVLIPFQVAKKVGTIDRAFFHNFGDFDYGLRAKKVGFSIYVAPGSVGSCLINVEKGAAALRLTHGDLFARWKAIRYKKLIHFPSRIRYYVRHSGWIGLVVALAPLRYLVPFVRKKAS